MRRTFFVLVLALCTSPFASAQANFSGNWVYDADASTLPYSGDLTIIHSGNLLTMIQTTERGTSKFEYNLDASERIDVTGERTFKYRAVLEGNILHITGTVTSNAMVSRPSDNMYILSDNGRTLTRLATVVSQRERMVRKLVFRKK